MFLIRRKVEPSNRPGVLSETSFISEIQSTTTQTLSFFPTKYAKYKSCRIFPYKSYLIIYDIDKDPVNFVHEFFDNEGFGLNITKPFKHIVAKIKSNSRNAIIIAYTIVKENGIISVQFKICNCNQKLHYLILISYKKEC